MYEGRGSPVSLTTFFLYPFFNLSREKHISSLVLYDVPKLLNLHTFFPFIYLFIPFLNFPPTQIREEPSSYSYESFENPLAANESQSFGAQKEERVSSGNQKYGTALYDFTAGGDDEVS